jgi:hypothetical protein
MDKAILMAVLPNLMLNSLSSLNLMGLLLSLNVSEASTNTSMAEILEKNTLVIAVVLKIISIST